MKAQHKKIVFGALGVCCLAALGLTLSMVDCAKDSGPKGSGEAPFDDVLSVVTDPAFMDYCESQMEVWDTNGDGKLSPEEAAAQTSFRFDCSGRGISSLAGIEYFTGIKLLLCQNNALTSLDVSQNTALTHLFCSDNQLSSLDVSDLPGLTILQCHNNRLTSLDLTGCTLLTEVPCYNNLLPGLDISTNTSLEGCACNNNPGDGTTFVVEAWFDNSSIPSYRFTSGSWTFDGGTINIDYQKII